MKDTIISFLTNMIAVILGIVITFTIQGKIDKAMERKSIRSSLELVRSELVTNMEDISIMSDYLVQEKKSARYFLDNLDTLDRCPEDSVLFHSGMIFADVSFTLCNDALELLKMSSMFQKIEDNTLSMKIIRAYDTCGSIEANLNRHITKRDTRYEESVNEKTVRKFASSGSIAIKDYLKTEYGSYSIKWLIAQPDPEKFTDVADVKEAIEGIDAYLQGNHLLKRR